MSDDEFNDLDLDDLERQIAALDGDGTESPPAKPKPKSGAKGSSKPPDDDIDVDKLLAELSDGGAVADDDDDEDLAKYGIADSKPKSKAAPPKQTTPAPEPKAASRPPKKLPPKQESENQDANGVDEDTLMAEEEVYHLKEDIISVTCLAYEIEQYIGPILDGELVGENYRDILDTQRDDWQMYVDRLAAGLQSGKIPLPKYLESIKLGLETQRSVLAKAQAKRASKTTVDRITKRLELLAGEIAEVKEQLGGGATEGGQMDEEKVPEPEEKAQPVRPKKQEKMDVEEPPKKPKFKVPEEKLEQLSRKLNQYKYFLIYCHENQIGDSNGLMAKVKDIKDLFKNPCAITPDQYQDALQTLTPITMEMILGMTPDQRLGRIEAVLKEANETFELMKEVGCSKEEAMGTVDTIKYLKKIQDLPTIRMPRIRVDELPKTAPNKHNPQIPEDCVRLTIKKLSGAGGHRSVFIKYAFEYGGNRCEGDTPYVGAANEARRQPSLQLPDRSQRRQVAGKRRAEGFSQARAVQAAVWALLEVDGKRVHPVQWPPRRLGLRGDCGHDLQGRSGAYPLQARGEAVPGEEDRNQAVRHREEVPRLRHQEKRRAPLKLASSVASPTDSSY